MRNLGSWKLAAEVSQERSLARRRQLTRHVPPRVGVALLVAQKIVFYALIFAAGFGAGFGVAVAIGWVVP